jgi:hypothetical protein
MIKIIREFIYKMAASFPTVSDCIGVRILAACGAAVGESDCRRIQRISSANFH